MTAQGREQSLKPLSFNYQSTSVAPQPLWKSFILPAAV